MSRSLPHLRRGLLGMVVMGSLTSLALPRHLHHRLNYQQRVRAPPPISSGVTASVGQESGNACQSANDKLLQVHRVKALSN